MPAERGGLHVAGFATQAAFLLGCGILDRLRDAGAPESARLSARGGRRAASSLSPAEMGELFKVLLLARGDVGWRSLALTDMTHRL